MTQGVVDRLLHRTQSDLFRTNPPVALFLEPFKIPRVTLEKHSTFKPVSKAAKARKTTSKASKKHQKFVPQITKKRFCENMVCALTSLRKPCLKSSNCQQFHNKINAKSVLETSLAKTQNLTHPNRKSASNGALKSFQNH